MSLPLGHFTTQKVARETRRSTNWSIELLIPLLGLMMVGSAVSKDRKEDTLLHKPHMYCKVALVTTKP